jgi:hypothetical protein
MDSLQSNNLKYIILDTNNLISKMRDTIEELQNFDADEEEILILIFQKLNNEINAESELAYECMGLIEDSINTNYNYDIERITKIMYDIGMILFKDLKRINAYYKHKLMFDFDRTIGNNIILVRNTNG